MSRAWTTEEDEVLKEGLRKKLSCSEIGKQLRRSKNSVIGRTSRMGFRYLFCEKLVMRKKLDRLVHDAELCFARNNGCNPVYVRDRQDTSCSYEGCRNTALPGYRHHLCNVHDNARIKLLLERTK